MQRIISVETLLSTPVIECHEPLVSVQATAPTIICEYGLPDMRPRYGETMYLRQGVVERLVRVAARLDEAWPEAQLRLAYAYRHPDIQQQYFERACTLVRQWQLGLSDEDIMAQAHLLAAIPEVAGHPTGGAVDITIRVRVDEKDVDIGTQIDTFDEPEKNYTFSERISPNQRANRMLLRELMMEQGFAPFDGEWWHFSYGDREWAAYYNQPHAIYDQILL